MIRWDKSYDKLVYSQRFFDVFEQKVILPSEKKRNYSIVVRKPISVVFPQDSNGKIILISQYRYLFGKRILEAVAGHIDEGETSISAAKRELKEETGIKALNWKKIIEFDTSASVIKSHVTIFLAKNLKMESPDPEEGEDIRVVNVSIDDAFDKVMKGEIQTAATIIGILILYNKHRGKI